MVRHYHFFRDVLYHGVYIIEPFLRIFLKPEKAIFISCYAKLSLTAQQKFLATLGFREKVSEKTSDV